MGDLEIALEKRNVLVALEADLLFPNRWVCAQMWCLGKVFGKEGDAGTVTFAFQFTSARRSAPLGIPTFNLQGGSYINP